MKKQKVFSQETGTPLTVAIRQLTILEMQAELAISRPTAQRLLDQKIIPFIRVGRCVRIPQAGIIEFIQKGGERDLGNLVANEVVQVAK